MKVLVVDDDRSTLVLLRLLLAQAGCRVECADGLAQAREALEREAFDWLIVDGQMSPGDGFEVAALAARVRPGIRTVMISGIYEPSDIEGHAIRALFRKPVDAERLVAHLREGRC